MKFFAFKWTLALPIMVSVLFAQDDNNTASLLNEIEQAYQNLNFTEAKIKAEAALEAYDRFKVAELTEIHKILGLIYFSQNRRAEARTEFENALSLNSALELDPMMVSPKIMEFFKQVKRDFLETQQNSDASTRVRYILVSDPRPAAVMRSMVLPGWGQLYKGEKQKGTVLMSLWTAGAVGSVITHVVRQNAQDDYLSATRPDQIEAHYDRFNTFHKLRNNFILFSVGVWLYSYFDAILKGPSENVGPQSLYLSPAVSEDRASIMLSWRF